MIQLSTSFPPILLSWLLVCITLGSYLQEVYATTGSPPEKDIEQLVKDLGDAQFEIREAATRALMERKEAIAALQKALNSPDSEVRRRAKMILEVLETKRARRALAQARALGKDGRVVEMVDRLVYWRDRDTEGEGWASLTHIAEKLFEYTSFDLPSRHARQNVRFPAGDFPLYVKVVRPKEISGSKLELPEGGVFLIRGIDVIVKGHAEVGVCGGIVAVSRNARLVSTHDSFIIAGGNIKMDTGSARSVIICDSDVELAYPPYKSLIIARGKVSHGDKKPIGCMIRSEGSLLYPDGKKVIIKDGTPDPLAFVKFFELADVGLTVANRDPDKEPAVKGVPLKDVRKDSPFAAGLRAGDVITAIEGEKTPTTAIFRRVLRRKLAQGGPILTFTVRRSGKMLDISLPLKD